MLNYIKYHQTQRYSLTLSLSFKFSCPLWHNSLVMILTLFYHCSEEERVSAYDIASKRSNWQRAGGWKLQRFALQLDEMVCSSLFLLTICKFITLLCLSSPLPLFFPLHSCTLAPFFSPPCFLCLPSSFLLLPSLPSPLFPLPPTVQGWRGYSRE